jgi:hypothetical protein
MTSIKYLSSYHGPNFKPIDQEFMVSHHTLADAMYHMRGMQRGVVTIHEYQEDWQGRYHPLKPRTGDGCGAEREDFMDVYHALPEEGGYILGEWAYRISVGPRGGIRVEKA